MAPQAGVNGVIPVAVLQKNPPQSTPRGPKAAAPRLKLVLRRLPPGLTKDEFDTILGEEWKIGAGKVDFTEYKRGKVSKDAAKPSKPTRVYFRVTSQAHVTALGDHIRQLSWQDAAKSYQDSALVGPPTLEFAPYPRIPANKSKQDSRQGTIDQDPEFKKFLEALTNPITKPAPSEDEDKKLTKVTTTPLLEALREKKASKEKPQAKASGKHGRGEPKDDATDRSEKKILTKSGAVKDTSLSTGSDKSRKPSKAEKATAAKEAVKALNKDASSGKGANAASSSEKATPSSSDKATPSSSEKATSSSAPERKRGNASIAKSMLQRDLGIGPAANRRRGSKREAPAATSDTVAQPGEVAAGKQKAKDTSVTPSSSSPASTAAGERAATSSAKKERPSRSDRRAFKASLAEKTNTKNQEQKPDSQAKPVAAPAPTILKKPQTAQTPTTPKGPSASRPPPTEPAAARPTSSKADSAAPSRAPPAVSKPAGNSNPAPASSGRQAFLKHANASQGITEPLIEEALKVFGTIEKVEIDKRKGFAYVDFAEPEGLQKAIAGSPIKVAQGAVHVLERKEKVVRAPPAGASRGRGGFGGRRAARGGARGGSGSPAVTAGSPAGAASPAIVAANPVT